MESNVEEQQSLAWQGFCIEGWGRLLKALSTMRGSATPQEEALIDAIMCQLSMLACARNSLQSNPAVNARYLQAVEAIVRETDELTAMAFESGEHVWRPVHELRDTVRAVGKPIPADLRREA